MMVITLSTYYYSFKLDLDRHVIEWKSLLIIFILLGEESYSLRYLAN